MNKEELKFLLERYASGNATESEKALLESWYLKRDNAENNAYPALDQDADAREIWAEIRPDNSKSLRTVWIQRIAAAALILVTLSSGLYFYTHRTAAKPDELVNEIKPGKNNAILILSNGKKISLDNAKNGELARETGIVISKAEDGKLVYTFASNSNTNQSGDYTAVETPNGGQYQLRLPDGTKIWLNAASSIRFPVVFSQSERRVELRGEAYFEVAKDKTKPFTVTTSHQSVTVLGTHFNISSYQDDEAIKTTLLEGSVKVTALGSSKIIKPGEQATVNKQSFEINMADVDEAIAWKNGYFRFNDQHIGNVARQLSRWYNVEFVFDGQLPTDGFNGVISRSKNLSQVLKMLEKTKAIHFQTQGRRIIVKQ